jgi:hypothetical protein
LEIVVEGNEIIDNVIPKFGFGVTFSVNAINSIPVEPKGTNTVNVYNDYCKIKVLDSI